MSFNIRYRIGHVRGSVNIPATSAAPSDLLTQQDVVRNKVIIVVGNSSDSGANVSLMCQ